MGVKHLEFLTEARKLSECFIHMQINRGFHGVMVIVMGSGLGYPS